ncbi:MAG: FG-GAP repeat domain-containing protein [Steroidobacteraceae bacterium]
MKVMGLSRRMSHAISFVLNSAARRRSIRAACALAGLLALLGVSAVVRSDAVGSASAAMAPTLAGQADPAPGSVAAAARAYPRFSLEQRVAIWQAYRASAQRSWKSLSWDQRMARIARAAGSLLLARKAHQELPAATAAPFQGNLTIVTVSPSDGFVLQRQANCSLSLITATFGLFPPSTQIADTQSSYERVLHDAAGLTTQADAFPRGCQDPTFGITSRSGAYLGETAQSLLMFAAWGYDPTQDVNELIYGSVNAGTLSEHSFNTDASMSSIDDLAVGDLNGDGVADIVGISTYTGSGGGTALSVWLANADGTLSSPTSYPLTGTRTDSAFVADVNGDGKNDVVAATEMSDASGEELISVLTGKGNGTLNAAQTVGMAPTVFHNMIGADVRGIGRLDIITSSGLVFLNNGDGMFATPITGFTLPPTALSHYGISLTAGDFNNDGKLDVAIDDGTAITVYLGNGAGTFTRGAAYATTSQSFGYLNASDLDGDGNADLYAGLAEGGMFFGDDFNANQAYAITGTGDGTFVGAPFESFEYNGANIADLNGDGNLDVVSFSTSGGATSFIPYLGDGKGGFSVGATLAATFTCNGTQCEADPGGSYALADVNGDGIPDLVYAADGEASVGVAVALGKGDGSFATPTFTPAPSFVPAGDFDYDEAISNIQLADFNHDGRMDLIYNYSDSAYSNGAIVGYYLGLAVQLGNGDGTFQAPKDQRLLPGRDYTAPRVPERRTDRRCERRRFPGPHPVQCGSQRQ